MNERDVSDILADARADWTEETATLRTERDEAFKLLERLEALRSDRWPTDLADVLTQAADMLKVVGEITANFRTLIAKGKTGSMQSRSE